MLSYDAIVVALFGLHILLEQGKKIIQSIQLLVV